MSACATCGTALAEGARFCFSCGTPVRAGCVSCGADLPQAARFCPSCGTAQTDGSPAAAVATYESLGATRWLDELNAAVAATSASAS